MALDYLVSALVTLGTLYQLIALREMGCGYGQGFLVARPTGAPGVEALIRTSGDPGEGPPDEQPVSECETTRVSG